MITLGAVDVVGRSTAARLLCGVHAAWAAGLDVDHIRVTRAAWDMVVATSLAPDVRWDKVTTALELHSGGRWIPLKIDDAGPHGAWSPSECLVEVPLGDARWFEMRE